MKKQLLATIILFFVVIAYAPAQTEFSALPKPVRKEYKKSYRKWKRQTHFRKSQKEIAYELLATRYFLISDIEQKYGTDKKMIYKEARSVNAKFFDNMKDMMTAYQTEVWEQYMKNYLEKRKKKLHVEVLSYYDFWRY